jgi:hypothetical protein
LSGRRCGHICAANEISFDLLYRILQPGALSFSSGWLKAGAGRQHPVERDAR